MTQVAIVGPELGEITMSQPIRMRILEDGSTIAHRLGIGEITIAPHTEGPPNTGTRSTTKGSMSCRGPPGSPSVTRSTRHRPERW